MRGATWLFFDVGEVLMDERPTNAAWAQVVAEVLQSEGYRFTIDQVLHAQSAAAAGGMADPKLGAVTLLTGGGEELYARVRARGWPLLDEPFDDARPALERLSAGGFRLGVIANQRKAEANARLEWSGLLELIEVCLLSGDVGLAKPDPAIFELALRMAGCSAGEAAMVGDRLDNDIKPAKLLGMGTVWLRRGLHEGYEPRVAGEEPDMTVWSLQELADRLIAGT